MTDIQNSKVICYLLERDRISELPWPILDNILGRLSMTDAVRTTILSKKWKNKWTNLSKLVFDDSKVESANHDRVHGVRPLSKFIYHALLSHFGQIESFSLDTSSDVQFSDVEIWISHLQKSGINEFTFKHSGDKIKVSLGLYSCQQLTRLDMCNIKLNLDVAYMYKFNGFQNLLSLELCDFFTKGYGADKADIASLVTKCPVLERLVLKDFSIDCHLSIQALKLKCLCLVGKFGHVIFENCPNNFKI